MDHLLNGLDAGNLAIMAIAVLLAAILRAFTGFGFALAALPVFSLSLPPTTAAAVIVLLTLVMSLQTLPSYWQDVPWLPMRSMVIFSAVGTLGGSYLLLVFSPDVFRLLIGITVMFACFLLARFKPAPQRAGGLLSAVTGTVSGLMNGALAIPGPPVIIYAMAVHEEARTARAFLMGFFLFSAGFACVVYGSEGIIGLLELFLAAFCYPAMLVGDKLGTLLFERHGNARHRKVAIAALFAIGFSVALAAVIK